MKNQLTKLKTRVKNQKGFTLIELMAVIAILAMIVLIAVPAVGSILAKAEKDSGEAHIAMIENAGELAAVGGLEADMLQEEMVDENGDVIFVDGPGGETPRLANVYSVEFLVDEGYLNTDMFEKENPFAQFEDAYVELGYNPSWDNQTMVIVENHNGTYTVEFIGGGTDAQ